MALYVTSPGNMPGLSNTLISDETYIWPVITSNIVEISKLARRDVLRVAGDFK